MPSKELITDIAALLADELPEGAYGFDYDDVAEKLCAGFRAALQEPKAEMVIAYDNAQKHGIFDYTGYAAFLAASALGEQSE
ncbi:hypothetical protein [Ochrobactrum sp. 3-3]|uniref:hypothetical protein n=1 Tax=Ochrobactrum sp. 3-3 TaxID=1830124 RepID=UPI000DEED2E4|nr:hypothetical protein [Ochrobactrum sp. 3-3]